MAVAYDEETGRTLYAHIVPTTYKAATARVDVLGAGGIMLMDAVTDSSRTYIGEIDSTKITNDSESTGSAQLAIPADMMSGEYTVEVNAALGDSLADIVTSDSTVSYANSNQPQDPKIASVTNAGDYRLKVTVTEPGEEDLDAYQMTVYKQTATEGGEAVLEPVDGSSGVIFDRNDELVIGGRLEIPENADKLFTENERKELTAGGAYGDGGKLYVGLRPGETYTVGVRKVKCLYGPSTPEEDRIPEKAVAMVTSKKVHTAAAVPLSTPQEANIDITIPGAKNISVEGRELSIMAGVHRPL